MESYRPTIDSGVPQIVKSYQAHVTSHYNGQIQNDNNETDTLKFTEAYLVMGNKLKDGRTPDKLIPYTVIDPPNSGDDLALQPPTLRAFSRNRKKTTTRSCTSVAWGARDSVECVE